MKNRAILVSLAIAGALLAGAALWAARVFPDAPTAVLGAFSRAGGLLLLCALAATGVALAVAGSGEDFCWPCGACRQMLYEFAPGLRVLVARSDGDFREAMLSELLPHAFGPESLE